MKHHNLKFRHADKIQFGLFLAGLLCLCIAGVFELWELYKNRPLSRKQIDELFVPVTNYGIKIVYEINEDFFSSLVNPVIPAGPTRHSQVSPINHQVLRKYPAILQKEFEKYPNHVIKKYLKAIHFAGAINQDGFHYAGSYDPFRWIIYLVDSGRKNDKQAMFTFHHEFSSLLLNSHSLYLNPWLDQNPKNFKYMSDVYDSWDDIKTTGEGSAIEYEKGFVTDYGQVSFENDFNEYAGMIFTYPQKFKRIMDQYPRVRGKFLVWLKFYQEIDPIFTEEYLFGKN